MLNKLGQNVPGEDNYFLVPTSGIVIAYCSNFHVYLSLAPLSETPLCQPQWVYAKGILVLPLSLLSILYQDPKSLGDVGTGAYLRPYNTWWRTLWTLLLVTNIIWLFFATAVTEWLLIQRVLKYRSVGFHFPYPHRLKYCPWQWTRDNNQCSPVTDVLTVTLLQVSKVIVRPRREVLPI